MSGYVSRVAVPDIGDFDDVPIIEILVAVGDTVSAEDPLVTLESDKATMDVPAPYGGVVKEILVSVDDTVSEGAELMVIEPSDGEGGGAGASGEAPPPRRACGGRYGRLRGNIAAVEPPPRTRRRTRPRPPPADAPADAAAGRARTRRHRHAPRRAAGDGGGPIYASPSARRLARERRLDIAALHGSGRGGRITRDDVSRAADGARTPRPRRRRRARKQRPRARTLPAAPSGGSGLDLLPWPKVDFEKFGPIERVDADADPADLGPEPGAQLGDDPARHAQRRGRHHRAGGRGASCSTSSTTARASSSRWSRSWSRRRSRR